MSAYAASKQGNIFEGEDIVIKYDQNSSDESDTEAQSIPVPPAADIPSFQQTFLVTEENVVYNKHDLIIGLKVNESIGVTGQFRMAIQRGAVSLNGIHYYHAPQEVTIIQPNFTSTPVISSTQVTNTDDVRDVQTDQNAHLFSSDYKSVVQISSLATGLEDISVYYPPFKNVFTVPEDRKPLGLNTDKYTFDVSNTMDDRLSFDREIIKQLDDITRDLSDSCSFMTIGNKNSGKSTMSKLLVNNLVESGPVSILDLDPGQSEYSKPYCLSITNHYEAIFGVNHHKHEEDIHYYYGFTTPQSNPEMYTMIIKSLVSYYNSSLKHRGHHLVINTPGWVKGYGKQLLMEITRMINPDKLILLTSNPNENDDILGGLTFKDVKIWRGSFIQSRYSAAEIRNFNKLTYFHQQDTLKYDFRGHLLEKSPFKVSFQTDGDSFTGINLVSIMNHDVDLNFNMEDLNMMLDTSIVGMYLIDGEHFSVNKHLVTFSSNSPPYLNSSDFNEFIEYNSSRVKFFGLGIIHSINTIQNYFNMYIPPGEDVGRLQKLMSEGYKLLVVKGESDIPTCEVLNREILHQFKSKYKSSFKAKEPFPSLPYISYNNKINGIWKIRRNVMRRSQN